MGSGGKAGPSDLQPLSTRASASYMATMRKTIGPTRPRAAYHTLFEPWIAEDDMDRVFVVLGSLSALMAVGLGAFAAHGLKSRLPGDMLGVFEVGVRYQMYHAFALCVVAWAATRWPGTAVSVAGWLFVVGTIVFSGSLVALSMGGPRWLGAITPIGGLAFLAGWGALAWAAWSAA